MNVLILQSSRFGHTLRMAERIAERLTEAGMAVTVGDLARHRSIPLDDVDAVVVGASIRYGYFTPALKSFAARNADFLNSHPTAFFGVNLVATKPGKDTVDTNAYTSKFLAATPWRPTVREVFAGELNYPAYNPVDRWLIQLIMKQTGKPTDPTVHIDYTDWDKVDEFAHRFAAAVSGPSS
ncbi:menaquinone-dependent protoporphyrinogen IX dehydrogenase [Propionicicella superfundia]|uniref:menaquinone-dependent protoporphyrinogen IX dehydrogenase n=1 Tax=Propionicicella superfundia TaxID=348582 RepID=UPI000426C578|nr:menaquinone-dependent protoporphyrinogen IX dehydrogenase [Propionicicella superfundia]